MKLVRCQSNYSKWDSRVTGEGDDVGLRGDDQTIALGAKVHSQDLPTPGAYISFVGRT